MRTIDRCAGTATAGGVADRSFFLIMEQYLKSLPMCHLHLINLILHQPLQILPIPILSQRFSQLE